MFSNRNEVIRGEQLQQTAQELAMTFTPEDEYGMIGLLRDFHLFNKGGRHKITNILSKTSPMMEDKVNIFDYKYTISTGKSSHSYHQSVFFIQSKLLAMPEMLMKPEHFFHKVGAWLGIVKDIDFEEHPQFSDTYLLQGEDEQHVRRTIGQEEVIRFFTIEKEWHLESIGYFMIFYQHDRLILPNEIKHLYHRGMMLFEHFKTAEWM